MRLTETALNPLNSCVLHSVMCQLCAIQVGRRPRQCIVLYRMPWHFLATNVTVGRGDASLSLGDCG